MTCSPLSCLASTSSSSSRMNARQNATCRQAARPSAQPVLPAAAECPRCTCPSAAGLTSFLVYCASASSLPQIARHVLDVHRLAGAQPEADEEERKVRRPSPPTPPLLLPPGHQSQQHSPPNLQPPGRAGGGLPQALHRVCATVLLAPRHRQCGAPAGQRVRVPGGGPAQGGWRAGARTMRCAGCQGWGTSGN